MEDLVIKNGLVVSPWGAFKGGLAVRNEKLINIGDDDFLPDAKLIIDVGGNYILPEFVDPHVHFGRAAEEDFTSCFKSESESAAISGVNTFMGFIRFGKILEHRLPDYQKGKDIVRQNSFIDFKFHAYLFTEKHIEEIPQLTEEGISSAKLMLNYTREGAERVGCQEWQSDY